ncbi:MAG: transposase zinc-binding domain-containing protein, partial [Clostridiaceae bacterium]|nr:transposase zinc-binding domain-containing protein [Clostridiaceae bacterium]
MSISVEKIFYRLEAHLTQWWIFKMIEMADILNQYGEVYRQSRKLSLIELKVMNAIQACRTAELGGHVDICEDCEHMRISYNSCRNRHCPKCQSLTKERCLERRKK